MTQETVKKIRESKSVQKSAKLVYLTFKVRGLQCGRVESTVGGFSSRRLQQLLQQRYKVISRIHILERKLLSIVEVLFRCRGFSYTAEFIAVVFAANCSRACIFKPQRTPNCAVFFQVR